MVRARNNANTRPGMITRIPAPCESKRWALLDTAVMNQDVNDGCECGQWRSQEGVGWG